MNWVKNRFNAEKDIKYGERNTKCFIFNAINSDTVWNMLRMNIRLKHLNNSEITQFIFQLAAVHKS